jgi:hypothetical protein
MNRSENRERTGFSVNEKMEIRNLIRGILNIWVIGGALVFAGFLIGLIILLVWLTRPETGSAAPATPVVIVIPAPTVTLPLPTPTPESSTPTPVIPPPPPAGVLAVGAYVQISGTGGNGLRVRADPGLQGEVRFLAVEAEVFRVTDGPQDADGYTWWYLVAPADKTRQGWAASNFLAVVQNP